MTKLRRPDRSLITLDYNASTPIAPEGGAAMRDAMDGALLTPRIRAVPSAPKSFLKLLDGVFNGLDVPVLPGATWMTDAPFRETVDTIEDMNQSSGHFRFAPL